MARSIILGLSLFTALVSVPSASSQCRLLKNDTLPDVISGSNTFAIVPGLCNNEAAMSVFDAGGAVRVREAGVVFAHRAATNGTRMIADLEIYDGATLAADGKWTLGPLVYKYSTVNSGNLQLTTTNYNSHTLATPVRVSSGRVVIAWRVLQNFASGSCQLGYSANFATDNAQSCTRGKNIIDAIGHGPIDPTIYRGFPLPLCPVFFRGSWVIRACVEPEVSVSWTGNATPGGFISLKFLAPGQAGDQWLGLVSSGTQTGFNTPWGKVPLDVDPTFQCFLGGCRGIFLGNAGTFNANGEGFGTLAIPNLASLRNSGFPLYVGFVTFRAPNFTPWKSISSPSPKIEIN